MPKLDSDLKDYFAIEEETKVKIKNVQYPAISIALGFFVIKRYFLRAEYGHWQKGARESCGPLMCFFNKHSYCKNNPTLTNHRSSLIC